MKISLAAAIVNNTGKILPFTVQATPEQCEKNTNLNGWMRLSDLGCEVKTVWILEDASEEEMIHAIRNRFKLNQNSKRLTT